MITIQSSSNIIFSNIFKNMTCFWDGLLNRITHDDINIALGENLKSLPNAKDFVLILKKHAVKTPHVTWNNELLTEKMLEENLEWINNLDPEQIDNGYDCSICDPYLCLVCELFTTNILHYFLGVKILYQNTLNVAQQVIQFCNNHGHFYICDN